MAGGSNTLSRIMAMAKRRKRDKAQFDVDRTQAAIDQLRLHAPADGTVNILENPRTSSQFGNGVEFREGDRALSAAGP